MTEYSNSIAIVNDGTFALDPGAAFGISPKSVWSKYFEPNSDYRIKLNTNLTIIEDNNKFYLLDGGIGANISDYYKKWFNAQSTEELHKYMKKKRIEKFEAVFHTHLHFDHSGHSFSDLWNCRSIASMTEVNNFNHPNDMAKASYFSKNLNTSNLSPIFRDTRFGNFELRITGGHTTGHMAIFYNNGTAKIIYAGDLFPTTFHLKPSRVTAIDQEPLKSLQAKKEILSMAIKDSWVIILSHDTEEKAVSVYGDVSDPKFSTWDGI